VIPKAPGALCSACPLRERPYAATSGPETARTAVVSRSPGHFEAAAGRAFSGPSGRVLDHLLQLQGLSRDEVIATNTVLCQSDGTEKGFGLAVACCEPRLKLEIANCDTVIACGGEAAQVLTGDRSIHRNRGYVHHDGRVANPKSRIIVTNNPAVVIRDDGTYPELVRDFRLAINPLPPAKLPQVRWTEDLDEAREWIKQIKQMSPTLLASDIETRGRQIIAGGFSKDPHRAAVFGEAIFQDTDFVKNELAELWELSGVDYLWHNGKFDVKILRLNGIDARVNEDSMLLSWCLDERPGNPESGAGGHSLEWLVKDILGWPKYEPDSVRQFKKTGELFSERDLYEYNGMDCAGTIALFNALKPLAINDGVWDRPYKSLLIRLSETLTQMELQGNLFDSERACNILEEEVWPLLYNWRKEMRQTIDGKELNPNSPKQLQTLLYDEWGIKHDLSRPKIERQGKRSTDASVREVIMRNEFKHFSHIDPTLIRTFVKKLDDWKSLDKQRGTYFEGLAIKALGGRLYTRFNIHGTESGRLSSAEPNLQNVTRPKEGIPSIRSCFIPDPGCVFISGDLSQAELRTIAALSGDEHLRSIYLDSDRSLHKEVAAAFYGDDYSHEEYVRAKNINFGVAYWQSAYSFSQMYNMPISEAQEFIDWWWQRFPHVWEWTKQIEQTVQEKGELQSPFGHKRRFYVIPSDESARLHVVKQGINFLPQNIAGNITLWSLCDFAAKVDWRIAQPRITVHDSILVNCTSGHEIEIGTLLKECMENAARKSIEWEFPYATELSIGENWGELQAFEV
jgi:uracil-DNA glycosylase family 4